MKHYAIAIIYYIILSITLVGCGDSADLSQDDDTLILNPPSLKSGYRTYLNKLAVNKTVQEELGVIKADTHQLSWAYYRDRTKDRWYISTTAVPYVLSLKPIVNGEAGWAGLSTNAAQINVVNDTVTIGNINNRADCRYYDYGIHQHQTNCEVNQDIDLIRNSTVDIEWWFFKASNESWYIINTFGYIYRFGDDGNGNYDWTLISKNTEPQFFVEDGYKKVKFSNDENNTTLSGIDVSDSNGSVNWALVKNSDVKYAFIKATEGFADETWPESEAFDSEFIDNMNGAISNGIYVGAYHYATPHFNHGTAGAKKEAEYFVSKIRSFYENNRLLPPVLDLEESDGYTRQELTDWAIAFSNEIEARLGFKPIIYMSDNYIANKVYINQLPYSIWVARYLYSAEANIVVNNLADIYRSSPDFSPKYTHWVFWQFSSTANDVAGVTSQGLDKNVFKGGLNTLESLLVTSDANGRNLTSVSPANVTEGDNSFVLTITGRGLSSATKVFIPGVADTVSFVEKTDSVIKVDIDYVNGSDDSKEVYEGYRDITVLFNDGSKRYLTNYFFVSNIDANYFIDLPYQGSYKVTQGNNDPFSHNDHGNWDNKYAIDLALPLNSTVISPVNGEVVCIYDENHNGGNECGFKANNGCTGGGRVIVVKDSKDNYITLLHLRNISVSLYSQVTKGDVLGVSGGSKGNNGACINNGLGYHLHMHLWNKQLTPDSHTKPFDSNSKLRVKVNGVVQYLQGDQLDSTNIENKFFESLNGN